MALFLIKNSVVLPQAIPQSPAVQQNQTSNAADQVTRNSYDDSFNLNYIMNEVIKSV